MFRLLFAFSLGYAACRLIEGESQSRTLLPPPARPRPLADRSVPTEAG